MSDARPTNSSTPETGPDVASGWFVQLACGLAVGVVLTGGAGALKGDQGLNPLTWLGTTATVAALVVAIGIYRLQRSDQAEDNKRLHERLDDFTHQLEQQDQLIRDLAADGPTAEFAKSDPLTEAQRNAIEEEYGPGKIATAWLQGQGRGNRPRLVRLTDGRLVSVYSGGRKGGTYVHELGTHRIDQR